MGESFVRPPGEKRGDIRRVMKVMGIPQQKPRSNVAILLRSPSPIPTVRFPPTIARNLHIQSVHAGSAVEAPMISLAAVVVNGV